VVYRKGELSRATIDWRWPHQIALQATRCHGENYVTIRLFCEPLSLCTRTHSFRRDDQDRSCSASLTAPTPRNSVSTSAASSSIRKTGRSGQARGNSARHSGANASGLLNGGLLLAPACACRNPRHHSQMRELFDRIHKHPWIARITVWAILGFIVKFATDKLILDGLRDLIFAAVGRWLGISDVNALVAILSYVIPILLAATIIWGVYRFAQYNVGIGSGAVPSLPRAMSIPLAASQPDQRDVAVDEANAYLCFGTWGRSFFDAAASSEVDANWELKQFQQAAADGHVPVWGRQSRGRLYEPIQKEYWLKCRIDWFSLLRAQPQTEPYYSNDTTQPRYTDLMTSRTATERLLATQPAATTKVKLATRQLAKLFDDGVKTRNGLLPQLDNFDATECERTLIAWDEQVAANFDDAGVKEAERSRFNTLDVFERRLFGANGRSQEQERLEAIWNKKLQILRSIIDRIGE
jgi:hypothetical protein